MSSVWNSMPYILTGFGTTLVLSVCVILLSILLGILLGIVRTSQVKVCQLLARWFITIFRGIPSLVVLYMVFFILPEVGIEIDAFVSAVIGLSMWGIANVGELTRGAIQSLPRQQFEAGMAIGMKKGQIMWNIILPQAFRMMLPSLIGIVSNLVQNTTLASFIGTTEFVKACQYTIERIQLLENIPVSLIVYTILLIGYFIICFPLSILSRQLQNKMKSHG